MPAEAAHGGPIALTGVAGRHGGIFLILRVMQMAAFVRPRAACRGHLKSPGDARHVSAGAGRQAINLDGITAKNGVMASASWHSPASGAYSLAAWSTLRGDRR